MGITELRKYKIPGTNSPALDWIATVIGALILAITFKSNFPIILFLLIILSILLHILFKIPTTTNFYLGLSDKPAP